MINKIIIRELDERKQVKLEVDKYGDMYLCTMRNGYQWSSIPVDDKLLKLIESIIHEYFGEEQQKHLC